MSRPHTEVFVHLSFEKPDCKTEHSTPFSTLTDTNTNWFTHYFPIKRMLKYINACAF